MKIAIFENIMTPGGHEVDFDRILTEELRALGHEVVFYVPEGFRFGMDYHTDVHYLPGASVSYTNARGFANSSSLSAGSADASVGTAPSMRRHRGGLLMR